MSYHVGGASSSHPPAPHNGGFAAESAAGGHYGGFVGSSYASYQRAPPDRAGIDGKLVYMFGTGADRMKKTEGKLVLCAQSGEIKIEVPGYEPLSATEFSALAKHKWKRPRQSIKLAQSDQSLEEFEYSMNAVPPGTCRRYPYERDTEEQQRAEVADTAHMRQLRKAHERNLRRSMKRKVSDHPNDIGVVGQAELPETRAGTWASAQDASGREIAKEELERKADKVFRMWKKNSSLLYDFVMIQLLECPSLTVQWLPETRAVPGYPDFLEHRLLLGTYQSAVAESEQEPERTEKRGRKPAPKPVHRDYLMVAGVQVPRSLSDTREGMEADEKVENNVLYPQAQVDMVARYGHSGEVNRARYMPQNPRIVATKSGGEGGELYLFDMQALGNKLLTNKDQHSADHYLTLRGHTKEGYGLCWNERKSGYLLSGSHDNRVCVWDVLAEAGKSRTGAKQLDPLNSFQGHTDCVGDVAWSPHQESVFFSVGDDKKVFIWDLRSKKASSSHVISQWAVNSIACNTFSQHIFATGTGCKGSGVVRVWDDRKMDAPLNELVHHHDVVDVVSWSPHHEHILASGGRDRKVHVLDIQKAPPPSRAENPEPSLREVMFVHGGHRNHISDIAWNPECPWFVSSVSDGEFNVNFWQPTQEIWANYTGDADDLSDLSVGSDEEEEEGDAGTAVAGASSAADGKQGAAATLRDRKSDIAGVLPDGNDVAHQGSINDLPAPGEDDAWAGANGGSSCVASQRSTMLGAVAGTQHLAVESGTCAATAGAPAAQDGANGDGRAPMEEETAGSSPRRQAEVMDVDEQQDDAGGQGGGEDEEMGENESGGDEEVEEREGRKQEGGDGEQVPAHDEAEKAARKALEGQQGMASLSRAREAEVDSTQQEAPASLDAEQGSGEVEGDAKESGAGLQGDEEMSGVDAIAESGGEPAENGGDAGGQEPEEDARAQAGDCSAGEETRDVNREDEAEGSKEHAAQEGDEAAEAEGAEDEVAL